MSAIQSLAGRRVAGAAAAVILAVLSYATPGAQSGQSITFPVKLAAGPDYATDLLRDPWDFGNTEDVGLDPAETIGWSSFAVSGGTFNGTTATSDAQMSLLASGFYAAVNPGKMGVNFPIDTSRYQKLSFRMSSNTLDFPQFYWFHTTWQDPADAALAPDFDRNFGGVFAPQTIVGYKTFVIDLASTPNAVSADPARAWSASAVRGLRLDPGLNAGQTMSLDWVRLTVKDSDPAAVMQPISWTGGTGNATITVTDAGGTVLTITPPGGAISPFIWYYGILPPGAYTLTITNSIAQSQAFTINNPPSVQVTDPSRTTGQDYATRVQQNPWDMDAVHDIVLTGNENITGLDFNAPGFPQMLTATNTNSDPNITLLSNGNNQGGNLAIDTARYKYLTYRMQIDGPVDVGNGSIARVLWGSAPFFDGNSATTTKDILVFGGMQSYTVDLTTLSSAPGGGLEPFGAQEPWATNRKTHLRFDPHEFGTNPGDPTPTRTFHIDDVKLTADPVSFASYTIKFGTADADSDPVTVNLYYDTDKDPANGKTLIAAGLAGGPAATYSWNTSAVPVGAYFIYAEATDLTDVRGSYSDAPLVVSAPCTFGMAPSSNTLPNTGGAGSVAVTTGAACDWTAASNAGFITITSAQIQTGNGSINYTVAANPARTQRSGTMTIAGQTFTVTEAAAPAPFDFDGDGRADRTVYRPSNGYWFTQNGAARQYGQPGDVAVAGDYDGNHILDTAVFRPSTGDWFIDGQASFNWGRSGDVPVPGDYDGNGTTDAAVYRTSDGVTGVWFVRNVSAFPRTWGLRGDVPVPGDYDGDGKLDPAVYRPRTGQWFINYSLSNYANNIVLPWGQPGDIPVQGDFDGDGKTDVAVFRPSNGIWYIAFAAANFTTFAGHVWGIPGDVPVAVDLDGDRVDDLTVYRPSEGMWWTYNRITGGFESQQWGVTGDVPVGARPQVPAIDPVDFDGDGAGEITVYRPSTGEWVTSFSSGQPTRTTQWGLSGDVPVQGDYDGDGRADYAVFRPSNGYWFVLLSSTNYANYQATQWGQSGDVPVQGDYDGDGRTDIGVFRPSDGSWFVLGSAVGFTVNQFGQSGDIPVPADYDGDGRVDRAVFRPSSGTWFITFSSGAYGGTLIKPFGSSTDVPVPADYDGDGRTDIAIYRPSTGFWIGADVVTSSFVVNEPWGSVAGDVPVPADYNGDRLAELAVYRPSTNEWRLKLSSGGTRVVVWGQPGDQPIKR